LPNVEETDRYITSRLLVAGAERTDIFFSPAAVDYIFRCSEGIPRNINNLCDNALLAGYAAGERRSAARLSKTWPKRSTCCRARIAGCSRAKNAKLRRGFYFRRGRAELWNAGKPAIRER
jgi:hypothetical protein